MRVIKVTFENKDGSVVYTDIEADINKLLIAVPRGITWKHGTSIDRLRNQYFRMISELAKETNSGNTKTDLHNSIKPIIMGKFTDFPHYFIDGVPTRSTTNLSREGWIALIEQLKVAANDIFTYTFK